MRARVKGGEQQTGYHNVIGRERVFEEKFEGCLLHETGQMDRSLWKAKGSGGRIHLFQGSGPEWVKAVRRKPRLSGKKGSGFSGIISWNPSENSIEVSRSSLHQEGDYSESCRQRPSLEGGRSQGALDNVYKRGGDPCDA